MRVRTGLACAVAVLAAGATAAPATADHGVHPAFDPQATNVPYLAWRGEELRLVKCSDDIDVEGQLVDWIVEDWSGYAFQPPSLEPSTVKFFAGTAEHEGQGCVKADFVSLKAGLAQIKLVVSDAATGNPVLKHQFLAGWLSLVPPSIREVSAATGPTDPIGGGGLLGDPSGDGNFVAGGLPGRVQVLVRGSLPLGNNFTELGLPPSITLPVEDDGTTTYWDDLAQRLAATSDARPFYRDAPWRMWDIHDDPRLSEGHVDANPVLAGYQGPCGAATTVSLLDAVDACTGADFFVGVGRFSRQFGDLSRYPTIGPFDPLRADETLLPDGKLDRGDVPMPPALVEVAIAANRGGTDIGGVGALGVLHTDPEPHYDPVLKCIPYTRDHKCTGLDGPHFPTTPNIAPPPFGPPEHNHFAPYYLRWIPATFAEAIPEGEQEGPRAAEASGNDGPPIGNNFPGYKGFGAYPYWIYADVLREGPGGDTKCLRRRNDDGPDFRQLPEGPQAVQVFSDEHGEAQVYFSPGTGFFFDALGRSNLNGGCDLEGIDVLGRAEISAIARYPYQKTTGAEPASTTITKTVHSRFHKEVSCVPKGPVPPIENSIAFICTASGIDIDGTPFTDERVCFMSNGEGMRSFPLGTPAQEEGLNRLCLQTDEEGEASVEIFCKFQRGNVIAEFVDEGLLRFAFFQCGPPSTTTTTTTTTPAPTTSTTPTTSTVPATTSTTTQTPPPSTSTATTTAPAPTTTSTPPTTPKLKDVCPNLRGAQKTVPSGKTKVNGKCVNKKKGVKAKRKRKTTRCIINGRPVSPCVRGKG